MQGLWLAAVVLAAASWSQGAPMGSSFAVSSFSSQSMGPDGRVLGFNGYSDSSGRRNFVSYTVDRTGRLRVRRYPGMSSLLGGFVGTTLSHMPFGWRMSYGTSAASSFQPFSWEGSFSRSFGYDDDDWMDV
ncbi:uncharacterized protein LOC144152031 [Haemaphysalis longicornis]